MYGRLREVKNYFLQVTEKARCSLKKNGVEGHLRVCVSHGTSQYWFEDKVSNELRYLSKRNAKDMKLARQLAQRDYDRKVLAFTQKVIRKFSALETFLEKENGFTGEASVAAETDLSMAREMILEITPKCQARRALICPHELTTEEYVSQWYKLHGVSFLCGSRFGENRLKFPEKPVFTDRGKAVRSKSEKIIADKLKLLQIPYIYEYPLKIGGTTTIYPDFLILNTRTRQEIILEHFGLLSNAEYAEGTVRKINSYLKAGYRLGENLLFTMESSESPLDTGALEKLLKNISNCAIIDS